ncbi:DNA-directed RNA polymerase subunit alpha C-terminal domain-containing protein [Streptomyces sp.]|uniref:DNA-directed RNA polymerase subunit alpha C-terminal domain-containing protein n=1 Tax=Streptomyces sp. TaxID=1931 RepID=UPI002F940876
MTATFKPGDKVRITIDAEVADVADGHWSRLDFAYDSGLPNPFEGFVYTGTEAVTVRHVVYLPAEKRPEVRALTEAEREELLTASIRVLGLPARVVRMLGRYDIKTVGQVVEWSMDELREIRGFGEGSEREVRTVLAGHGLELAS